MRKALYLALMAFLSIFLAACGTPAAQDVPTVSPSPTATEALPASTQEPPTATPEAAIAADVVVFNDALLESRVREAMNRPTGDISYDEAAQVTELNLSVEWQQHIPEETQIKDLSGLEHFTGLTKLDLSFNAVTDISPLAGLTGLQELELGGNPVVDISPISGLTNLTWLTLFNCQAADYSPLADLANLQGLMLDYSTIDDVSMVSGLTQLWWLSLQQTQVSDVAPLAGLTHLTRLQLEGCPVEDYTPLAAIYPHLDTKDFWVASSLSELGFAMSDDGVIASYAMDGLTITVNHSEWGLPPMDLEGDSVRVSEAMDDGYTLTVGYYPDIHAYAFSISRQGDQQIDYVCDPTSSECSLGSDDRESAVAAITAMLGVTFSGDLLLAPVPVFEDAIANTFGMTPDALYALPFEVLAPESPTLANLGFHPDATGAMCVYEQHDPTYVSIEVPCPGATVREFDVRFFTPVNDYGLVVTYYNGEQRFYVGADKGETYAKFNYYAADDVTVDEGASGDMTVEQYLTAMYNDPSIGDVYRHSVWIAQDSVGSILGVKLEDLCTLPLDE